MSAAASPFRIALPAYLSMALLLGGASASGPILNGLLQLVGIALIWRALRLGEPDWSIAPGNSAGLRIVMMCIFGWIAIQLVPLPPQLWSALPGRSAIAEQMALLGNTPGWRPIAIEWERTVSSALALIPPLAVLAMALRATRETLTAALIALFTVAVVSMALGLAQVIGGETASLRLYPHTVKGTSAGFFANNNHFATLLCAAAALAIPGVAPQRKEGEPGSLGWIAYAALSAAFLINLAIVNRSLAGLGLAAMVTVYGAMFLAARIGDARRRTALIGAAGMAGIGAVAAYWLAPSQLTGRLFANSTDTDSRAYLWDTTWAAIRDTFPAGTGLGNFRWFFPRHENPDVILPNYANHAHNDWLEFLLEGGVFAAVIAAAVVWFLISLLRAAMAGVPLAEKLRRASPFVVLAVLLLHSVVDYPLRTSALAAVAALAIAMAMRRYALGARDTD